jgi:hypothetical protein
MTEETSLLGEVFKNKVRRACLMKSGEGLIETGTLDAELLYLELLERRTI